MKDDRGLYYYPFPYNKRVRMYVCKREGEVCFRLWNADDAQLWEQHGWIPYDAIKQATGMYAQKKDFDPDIAYDLEIAQALIKEGN
ncbi:MAG: hypothetical protein JRF27_03365 [Deltaproteobacteria bacterium]|nr:hypothetical protein [Deltaproteobacteria bacterium]MBW2192808.1 hypothetical protein [Deltaproteobacteria bacterium]